MIKAAKKIRTNKYFVSLWKRKIFLIAAAFLTLCVMLEYHALTYDNVGKGFVSLNYEEAASGQNPNGTRFNIYELESDELLTELIETMNLDGIVTCSDLRDMITLSPANTKSISERYIATGYNVTLYLNKELPYDITAQSLLNALLSIYHSYFFEHYGIKTTILDLDWDTASDFDYLEFSEVAENKTERMISYLQEMISESGTVQYQMEGETFQSLKETVENFKSVSLEKYNAFIQQHNLFKDPDSYRSKLVYQQMLLNRKYEQAYADYQIRLSAVENYDESMITYVMVPMYDASNGLYMTRTELGTDKLTQDAEEFLASAEEYDLQIKETERTIRKIKSKDTSKTDQQKADEMIQTIMSELNGLAARITTASDSYISYRQSNDIQCTSVGWSVSAIYQIKKSVMMSGIVFLTLCVFFILYDIKTQRKR